MKFITISKIPNTSQMLIIPILSMHYINFVQFLTLKFNLKPLYLTRTPDISMLMLNHT